MSLSRFLLHNPEKVIVTDLTFLLLQEPTAASTSAPQIVMQCTDNADLLSLIDINSASTTDPLNLENSSLIDLAQNMAGA